MSQENIFSIIKDVRALAKSKDTRKKLARSEKTLTVSILNEIQSKGLTYERLKQLHTTYPVFVYKTGVTIHGIVKTAINPYCGGYKSLTVNQNGTLAVKYSAVDVDKKIRIQDTVRLAGIGGWRDSQDFYLYKAFHPTDESGNRLREYVVTKELMKSLAEKALAWSKTLNLKLFNGNVNLGFDNFQGVAYVTIHVHTIPEKSVDAFIENITGKSIAELNEIKVAKELKAKADMEKWKSEAKSRQEKEAADFVELMKSDARTTLTLEAIKSSKGIIAQRMIAYDKDHYAFYISKNGEMKCYKVSKYDIDEPINFRKGDTHKRNMGEFKIVRIEK